MQKCLFCICCFFCLIVMVSAVILRHFRRCIIILQCGVRCCKTEWSRSGSNRRPHPCEGCALPTEPLPHFPKCILRSGEGGIRTRGCRKTSHAFQACSLSRSDTSPEQLRLIICNIFLKIATEKIIV